MGKDLSTAHFAMRRSAEEIVRLRSSILFFLFSCCVFAAAWGQAPRLTPRIDKIDPPNWWATLPSPMLLVHGENLDHASVSVEGKDVRLTKTQLSANGHWAILWLDTEGAAAQTLNIRAENAQGKAEQAFVLQERKPQAHAQSGFSSSDVLYLVMTDRFAQGDPAHTATANERQLPRGWHGGDFAGIEQHIDYLKQLGVTAVWTTPVASNGTMPESYHGYAATDLYAVDGHFGTLADYRHLSDALHAQGIKLVIDLVPNHIGVEHPWVLDPPALDWLHGSLQNHRAAQFDFYQLVDPHATPASWRNITSGWFTDAMPDLNQENPLVKQYLIENALWWVETANLDGIRLDTFPYVDRAFWHDFHATLHQVYPHLTTVGEVFNPDAEVTSFFAGGAAHEGIDTGLDTPFDFPVYFTLRDVLTHGKPMTDLAKVLRQDALYPHPERLVTFIGNHDTTRFITEASGSLVKLKLALGLIATLRGMPQFYAGDEIGLSGNADPDNRHDFPGGFVGDKHDAFVEGGRNAGEQEAFAWTAALLHLRAAHPTLQSGMEQNLFADKDRFAFVRTPIAAGCSGAQSGEDERILVVVNNSEQSKSLDLPLADTALAGCSRFEALKPSAAAAAMVKDGKVHIEEPPSSMLLYAVRY
jgi:glycosidase